MEATATLLNFFLVYRVPELQGQPANPGWPTKNGH